MNDTTRPFTTKTADNTDPRESFNIPNNPPGLVGGLNGRDNTTIDTTGEEND